MQPENGIGRGTSPEIRDTLCGDTYILEGMKKKTQPRNAEAERKARAQKEAGEKRGVQTFNAFTPIYEEEAESEPNVEASKSHQEAYEC